MRSLECATGDGFSLQSSLERFNRSCRTGNHASTRAVLRGQRKFPWQACQQLIQGQSYRQHGAGRLRLHQTSAPCNQTHGIHQTEYTCQCGGHELTHTVAYHRRRLNAATHPQPGHGIFHREDGGLHYAGWQQGIRIVAKHELAQVEGKFFLHGFGTGIESLPESGFAAIKLAPHTCILRPLPRKQEHHITGAHRLAAGNTRRGF